MRHPDSTDIMESHWGSYSVGESQWRFIWLCLRFEIKSGLSGHMNLPCYTRWWDDEILKCYVHDYVDFTTSSMIDAGLIMLISIHESYGSRVKCLCVVSQ